MQPSLIDPSHAVSSADSVDVEVPSEPEKPVPYWRTYQGQRRRTLFFLVFAAIYIGYHLVMPAEKPSEWPSWLPFFAGRAWVFEPLFNGDWYYFGGERPSWFESIYRWFLTLLPLAVWTGVLFVILTRLRFLTHRRVAFLVIIAGLLFVEGDMRWFRMSQRHVSTNELMALFGEDASHDLGLTDATYDEITWQFVYHGICLAICAFLAGPEFRSCLRAVGKVIRIALVDFDVGPISTTYLWMLGRWCGRGLGKLRIDKWVPGAVGWLDSKPAFACLALLLVIDPIVIWSLDKTREDVQGEKTVVRQIADTNPMRLHSLDWAWSRVVFTWSTEAQELAAANGAMRELDSFEVPVRSPILAIAKPKAPAQPYDVLILQAETLSAEMFNETLPDLPCLSKFTKQCIRLNNHFSVGNATHYGIMGLLHGSPVTFFTGPRDEHRPNPYLDHFKENGYKTRLISRSVMSHHRLGHYLPNWTEPVSEPPGDFKIIPPIHEALAEPGPQLVYAFYHATHYPYDHDQEPRFEKFLPEVDYEFNYNRPRLLDFKEQIVNRYKNTLLNMDVWFDFMLDKVDLSKTIVVITGDHGEEFFQKGRLGHCSSLNIHQTRTPGYIYIPGVEPCDVDFITSNADIMPTIADALGHARKPDTLGQSLFAPVSFRYAVLSHFDYTKCKIWAVATDDPVVGNRMVHFERDYWDNVAITSLTDWDSQRKAYHADADIWIDSLRIIRRVEQELRAASRD